tara:strand:+ start:22684 stop:25242 length:2559 start_codon:yes stop_codon:yes gene_type:complete
MAGEQPASTSTRRVAGGDARLPQAFNEAYEADGKIRPHWQYLLNSLNTLGPLELAQRHQILERILRDDGATYNDYSAGLTAKPWTVDPIPLLIDSAEWGHIERGIRERAELLNLILRDLYGERTLLKHDIIPGELIYSDRNFLRSCQGIELPGEQHLVLYAADLVRSREGDMRVISDRAQTPSGAGYALENRMVMTRVFPSLFRDSHPHRLSLYFNSLRLKLNELNPNGDIARVAILTPGAYNETYFEHAFLANHLGYQLVQGNDLVVRDGYVWMKTLDGLSRIDVILRRVDDFYCDPVELRGDSQLGIPGLLEVVRMGNVAVVNPLGTGILENRGLPRFLDAAARHFLGRELSLKSPASYWCGNPRDQKYALDNLDSLIIKTTFRGPRAQLINAAELGSDGMAKLRAAIINNPVHYVAQEFLQPSNAPVWDRKDSVPRPALLRSFAVADKSSYTVMPGGLTRVGTQAGDIEISNKLGSLSKDTWVLASEPEKQTPLTSRADTTAPANLPWGAMKLPSRVVENLFWAGRYTERAESALRLLRTVFTRLHGVQPLDSDSRPLLLRAVTQLTGTYPGFMAEDDGDPEKELLSVVLDESREGSVIYSLRALVTAVDQVKDFMSADTQRILNDLRDDMEALPRRLSRGFSSAPEEELDTLITTLLALAGLSQESMARGQGWHFLDMGRRIERTLQTCSLLRSLWVPASPGQDEVLLLESALVSAEALMTYRRSYQRDMNIANGLDLLLLEPEHPRSMAFQLKAIGQHLQAIPRAPGAGRISEEERLIVEAVNKLQLSDLAQLASVGKGAFLRSDLDQLLSRIQWLVTTTADVLCDKYFVHSAAPQPLSPSDWDNLT